MKRLTESPGTVTGAPFIGRSEAPRITMKNNEPIGRRNQRALKQIRFTFSRKKYIALKQVDVSECLGGIRGMPAMDG